jgi:hypothetical protein
VLMDRPLQAHLSCRFSDFLMALKRVNVLLGLNSVTAQVRLANNVIKGSPGFSIFVPGDYIQLTWRIFLPSATHAPLSLQDAGWTDEDSSSRPVAARALAVRPGPQERLPGVVSAGPP